MIAWLLACALAQEPVIIPPAPSETPVMGWPGEPQDNDAHVVELELSINSKGILTDVRALSGDEPFRSTFMATVQEMSFSPATEDGTPIDVVVPYSWTFQQPPVNLSGFVRVAGERRPAPSILLSVGDARVMTDEDGRFGLRGVSLGDVTVRLNEPSFRMEPVTLDITEGQRTDVELWLIRESWGNEVVGAYSRSQPVTTVRRLSYDDIQNAPGGLGDPVRALQNLPGLSRTPLDAGWLMLRGGFPEDTPVFLDGVPIPALYHLGGLTSIVHPETVGRIDLYPGSTPARLSRGLSGAAEMTSRRLTGDLRVVGGVNLAFSHLYAEAPLGDNGGISLSGRRSYLDTLLSLAVGEEGAQIAPRFADAQARIDTPNAGLIVTGMWDEASIPAEEAGDLDEAGQRAIVIQGRVEGDIGDVHLAARPWLSVNRTDISGFRTEIVDEMSPGGRLELSGHVGDVNWLVGTEAVYRDWQITRNISDDPQQAVRRNNTSTYIDPYAEVTGGTQDVRIRGGLRLDTLFVPGQLARAGLSPRIDGRLRISDTSAFTAAAWQSHQEPPRTFLLGFPDGPYLDLERSTGMSVGANTQHSQWGGEFQLWGRLLKDVVGFETDGTLQGYGMRAAGVEAQVWAQTGILRGELIYQYTLSEAQAEPGDAYRSIRFEQPHRLVALFSADLPKQWRFGGRWRYSSGVPIPGNSIVAYDILRGESEETIASKGGRLPAYHALDLRISRKFTFNSWRLNAFVDVQNVYGRRIPEPAINGIDETLVVYGYGLPILPLFGIDAEIRRKVRD